MNFLLLVFLFLPSAEVVIYLIIIILVIKECIVMVYENLHYRLK